IQIWRAEVRAEAGSRAPCGIAGPKSGDKRMNTTKTVALMVGLTVLLVFVGGAFGGRNGMIIAFIFAFATNMFSYWFSDKLVLRMYNAREVTEAEAPMLWGVTHDLSVKMNMPMPKVYVRSEERRVGKEGRCGGEMKV